MLRMIRRPEVEHLTGLSRSSIYALMNKGRFPKPVRISAKAVGWPSTSIENWLESRPCL